jgi:benzoylformate decarboxylase
LGRDVLLAVLESEGVRHIFGNPGTTELGLIDALAGPEGDAFDYVLSLQEATVVAMADGYAQATGRPAFINVHTMAGLGNAMGNLVNAVHNRAPLVVTAGNADRRHLITDPLLSGDLVGLAHPIAKWGHEVRRADDLGTVLRRAFLDAATPQKGPVFMAIPSDVLDEATEAPVPARSKVLRAGVAAGLEDLAGLLVSTGLLVNTGGLALVAGEEVASGDAVPAMVELAEALGCRVWGSPLHSATVFPTAHPQWAGPLPPQASRIRAIWEKAAVKRVFLVGSQPFLAYPYSPGPPLPEGVELLQLAPDGASVGRSHPVRLGVVGDVRASLHELVRLVGGKQAKPATKPPERAPEKYDQLPMDPATCVYELLRALPEGITVVDEAITTGSAVRRYHRTTGPGQYFFCRGGGLGWGMPAACGISLARGAEPVLCIVGDGSAMYSPQALWTAASRRLPVLFAVVNNQQYAILKANLRQMGGASAATGRYIGMDIDQPAINFPNLAQSMGVPAWRIEKASDVGAAAAEVWRSGEPGLLELPIGVHDQL